MPLSHEGETVKKAMIKEYGKERGTKIFYMAEHNNPSWTVRKQHSRKTKSGTTTVKEHNLRRRK